MSSARESRRNFSAHRTRTTSDGSSPRCCTTWETPSVTWILSPGPNGAEFRDAEATAAAYTDALERALGAATGSLLLVDAEMLREWFVEPVAVI